MKELTQLKYHPIYYYDILKLVKKLDVILSFCTCSNVIIEEFLSVSREKIVSVSFTLTLKVIFKTRFYFVLN
jgi:hypothetical protein